jgi:polyisoprenoid-binding protein YceI
MKTIIKTFILLFAAVSMSFAQGFKVKASGEQTFNFEDKRNQVKFFSTTPLEDITGISNDVKGKVSLNVSDIKSLKGSITISVASIKTAIDLRDEHLRSKNWLDADSYPEITFLIKNVGDSKVLKITESRQK